VGGADERMSYTTNTFFCPFFPCYKANPNAYVCSCFVTLPQMSPVLGKRSSSNTLFRATTSSTVASKTIHYVMEVKKKTYLVSINVSHLPCNNEKNRENRPNTTHTGPLLSHVNNEHTWRNAASPYKPPLLLLPGNRLTCLYSVAILTGNTRRLQLSCFGQMGIHFYVQG